MKTTTTKTKINKTDKITLLQNNLQNVRLSEGFNSVYSENMSLLKNLESGLKSFKKLHRKSLNYSVIGSLSYVQQQLTDINKFMNCYKEETKS